MAIPYDASLRIYQAVVNNQQPGQQAADGTPASSVLRGPHIRTVTGELIEWEMSPYKILGANCPMKTLIGQLENDFQEYGVTNGREKQKMALRVLAMAKCREGCPELSAWYTSQQETLAKLSADEVWGVLKYSIINSKL